MVKNQEIRIRVTKEQKERILNLMQAEGKYRGYSEFVRDKLLNEDISTRRMIQKIYEEVVRK